MNNLVLVNSENFGNVQCDFWENSCGGVFMTIDQLSRALEYADRRGVEKMVARNPYLTGLEFSVTDRMSATDGKQYDTRIFTEDGIYEVTMLSRQPKARKFRTWVRAILKSLRKGETFVIKPQDEKLYIQKQRAEAMLLNARIRQAKLILRLQEIGSLSPIAVELLGVNALEVLTDKQVSFRPETERTYTATEIANELGTTAAMVGRTANLNDLKTPDYGIHVLDKSPYSNKQVAVFRYNEKGRQKLKELLQ